MNETKPMHTPWEAGMKRNTTRLLIWTSAWTSTVALLAFGPKFIWDYDTTLTILAITINLTAGIAMINANIQHLRGSDELQQKIFLEACSLTLGVGLVCGGSFQLWKEIQFISFEPKISYLIILMTFTFMAKFFVEHWKNR